MLIYTAIVAKAAHEATAEALYPTRRLA